MSHLEIGLIHAVPEKLDHAFVALAVRDDDVAKGKLRSDLLQTFDALLGGALALAAKEAEFDGKNGSELTLHTHGKITPSRLALFGVGKAKDRDAARQVA